MLTALRKLLGSVLMDNSKSKVSLRHTNFLVLAMLLLGIFGSSLTALRAETGASDSVNLDDPTKKEQAMKLVSSAENSSTDWRKQFAYDRLATSRST